ncbi:MAG TPA: carbohydrate ABC transporter permease [Candidatus Limiplasma sp.]|nr:carbohydrate ABC transporter permease [Candidatus Limiplasma sp.]
MKVKESMGRKVFLVSNALILGLVGFLCLAPMLHVIASSISDPITLARERGFHLWPIAPFSFEGYKAVLGYQNILTGYGNTVFYVAAGIVFNLFLTTIAAYVLSRKRFMPGNVIMLFIAFTMLFNGGLIPNYLLIVRMGLVDNRLAVILPSAFNAFNLVIMRTSMKEIPEALEESARLDGANDLQILWHIIIPVSQATMAVITLFVAVSIWNSWFTASIYLTDRAKWPLQLFLREVLINNSQRSLNAGVKASAMTLQTLVKYCVIVVATLPILFIYPFLQKYFVKGIMIGSIKG